MELGGAQSLVFLAPELALAATALVVWLLARGGTLEAQAGEFGIFGAALSVLLAARLYGWGEVWLCERLFVIDGVALFAKILVGIAVVAAVWVAADSSRAASDEPVRILLAGIALELAASAANVWAAVVLFELAFLALAAPRESTRSQNALALGSAFVAVASLAWLSGFGGAADFEDLRRNLLEVLPRHDLAVSIASASFVVVLIVRSGVAGALSRSRTHRGVLVAVGLTAAVLALSTRFFLGALSEPGSAGRWIPLSGVEWRFTIGLGAVGVVAFGSAGVVRARSLAELLVAAAIVNGGWALAALTVATVGGLRSVIFMQGASAVAVVGAFLAASLVSRHGGRSPQGVALGIFLLSLGGVPLLGGFQARSRVLADVLSAGANALAFALIVSATILLFANLRVLRRLLAAPREASTARIAVADLCVLVLLGAVDVVLGSFPEPLHDFAIRSANVLPF